MNRSIFGVTISWVIACGVGYPGGASSEISRNECYHVSHLGDMQFRSKKKMGKLQRAMSPSLSCTAKKLPNKTAYIFSMLKRRREKQNMQQKPHEMSLQQEQRNQINQHEGGDIIFAGEEKMKNIYPSENNIHFNMARKKSLYSSASLIDQNTIETNDVARENMSLKNNSFYFAAAFDSISDSVEIQKHQNVLDPSKNDIDFTANVVNHKGKNEETLLYQEDYPQFFSSLHAVKENHYMEERVSNHSIFYFYDKNFNQKDFYQRPSLNENNYRARNQSAFNAFNSSSSMTTSSKSTSSIVTMTNEVINSVNDPTDFKSTLRAGLERQATAHRERLLTDLLQGLVNGGSAALHDFEADVNGVNSEIRQIVTGNSHGHKSSDHNWIQWLTFWKWKKDYAEPTSADHTAMKNVKNNTEEFIHNAYNKTKKNLSSEEYVKTTNNKRNKFVERTITGLINALAEEVKDLKVEVDADPESTFSNKTIHSIKILFSRLGFRQLRMGGFNSDFSESETRLAPSKNFNLKKSLLDVDGRTTADEAFEYLDSDESGALDAAELAEALKMAAFLGGNKFGIRLTQMISQMASRLLRLYDTNGDGFVDREEYELMVKDMAAVRDAKFREELDPESLNPVNTEEVAYRQSNQDTWFTSMVSGKDSNCSKTNNASAVTASSGLDEGIIDVTENENFWALIDQGEGSVVLEDLRLDLRRLLFGAIPILKKIMPGGPLILEPFHATVTASFTKSDIMDSFLLDAGLRRLVARALSRRVRGMRDLFDGAVFYGRTWKLWERNAPLVEVPKLQDVQFDRRNRLIITGRARIQAAPDAPSIENGFKLRTKIGTRENGRIIGLLQPEIAIFAECPKVLENNVRNTVKKLFDYTMPQFKPLYTFIPLVSPLKKNDDMDGFDLGEDNQIKTIEIKNEKLCFEIRAFLRPGRFLGNHYLAFTVPIRTLIITLDRVKEGMRTARRNKRLVGKAASEGKNRPALGLNSNGDDTNRAGDDMSKQPKSSKMSREGWVRVLRLEKELKTTIEEDAIHKELEASSGRSMEVRRSFIEKFVEGYSDANREELEMEMNARLSSSISEFFGKQKSQG